MPPPTHLTTATPSWRPPEAVQRDNALQPTEAELWLASLTPAEFQAVMMRVKGLR